MKRQSFGINQTVPRWPDGLSVAVQAQFPKGNTVRSISHLRIGNETSCFTIHKRIYGTYSASAIQGDRVNTTLFVRANSNSAYQLTSIDGKGLGFIATRRISAGEKILEERPIVMGNMTKLKQNFGIILAQLSSTKRQQIRALYNAFPEDNDVGILVTNSYGLGPQGQLSGLFENLSRLNHSCRPNSERCWDHDREVETLYALRCIETGEELQIVAIGDLRQFIEVLAGHQHGGTAGCA